MPAFQDPGLYRDILDELQIGVCVLDLERKIVFWSDGAEQITGYGRIDVLGRPCTDNILQHCTQSSCEMCAEKCPLAVALHDAKAVEAMSFIHHKSGYRSQVHTWTIPLRDKSGSIIGIIQTFEGERIEHDAECGDRRMRERGWIDEVTGLPNQPMMQSHLREALATFKELHIPFGIVCLEAPDLAKFRARYGLGAARSILEVLAKTLKNTVWATDFVGTWAEGQFLVVLIGCSDEALLSVGERILRMLASATIQWWGEQLSVTVSIGHAAAVEGDNVESLLQRAQRTLGGNHNTLAASAAAGSNPSSTG
jgi:diguanylate cyclase (GGDEF)-like protein/PAS domain S-box-containing protein